MGPAMKGALVRFWQEGNNAKRNGFQIRVGSKSHRKGGDQEWGNRWHNLRFLE
jgi:hypothetical protein